jgi:hypothetical protein
VRSQVTAPADPTRLGPADRRLAPAAGADPGGRASDGQGCRRVSRPILIGASPWDALLCARVFPPRGGQAGLTDQQPRVAERREGTAPPGFMDQSADGTVS